MKKTAIGHVNCPVCGFADAEVKEDKNVHAYIHCTDCNAQTFTRNAFRNGRLRERMRPVTVTVADTVTAPATVPEPAAPVTPPAPPPAPPPAKRAAWFTPILAGVADV